jgi:hypothetical protein
MREKERRKEERDEEKPRPGLKAEERDESRK